jgi:hypothetical protein
LVKKFFFFSCFLYNSVLTLDFIHNKKKL